MGKRSQGTREETRRENDRLEVTDREAVLFLGGKRADEARFEELQRLYELSAGDDMLGGETDCLIAVFPGRYWVIPPETDGHVDFWRRWRAGAYRAGRVLAAQLPPLPWAWRRRRWGFLPQHEARLGVHPAKTLPPLADARPSLVDEP